MLVLLITIISPLLSKHMPLHRRGRGGGSLGCSRTPRLRYGAGDYRGMGRLCVRHTGCRRTRSRDNPSDRRGRRLSGSSRRRACCGPQGAGPLSAAQSVPRPLETRAHRLYLRGKGHEPVSTSNYNSWALAG